MICALSHSLICGLLACSPKQDTGLLPDFLPLMAFVGRVVGKALYDGILIDVPFAPFFLNKVTGVDLPCLPNLRISSSFVSRFDARLYSDLSSMTACSVLCHCLWFVRFCFLPSCTFLSWNRFVCVVSLYSLILARCVVILAVARPSERVGGPLVARPAAA